MNRKDVACPLPETGARLPYSRAYPSGTCRDCKAFLRASPRGALFSLRRQRAKRGKQDRQDKNGKQTKWHNLFKGSGDSSFIAQPDVEERHERPQVVESYYSETRASMLASAGASEVISVAGEAYCVRPGPMVL